MSHPAGESDGEEGNAYKALRGALPEGVSSPRVLGLVTLVLSLSPLYPSQISSLRPSKVPLVLPLQFHCDHVLWFKFTPFIGN